MNSPRTNWAVVTGAGVRLGKAIALALAEEGFDLVIHYGRSRATRRRPWRRRCGRLGSGR